MLSVAKQKLDFQLEGYANPIRPDAGSKGVSLVTVTFLVAR